jgi:hypothetical protein
MKNQDIDAERLEVLEGFIYGIRPKDESLYGYRLPFIRVNLLRFFGK